MDLSRLEAFIARHQLHTPPEWSLLDMQVQLGELSRSLLKQTQFGQEASPLAPEMARQKIGDLMFALAYFSTLYDVDPEDALWESVSRFEAKLKVKTGDADD
jgi:NTP pyrophosphatase (non-canonical NTP hydrolase)